MAADGSIVINVDADDKDAQETLNKLNNEIKKLTDEQKAKEKEINSEIAKRDKLLAELEKKQKAYTAAQEETTKALEKQRPIVEAIEKTKSQIQTAETNANQYKQDWLKGIPGADIQESQARDTAAQLKQELSSLESEAQKYDAAIEKAAQNEAKLKIEVEQASTAWKNAKYSVRNLQEDQDTITRNLNEAKDAAGELEAQLMGAGMETRGMSDAAREAAKRMEKFESRVKNLARRIFVFSLITKALRSLKDYLWKAIKTNDEAVFSIAQLKGALLTLAQPIINVLIPAFTALVNMLTRIVSAISSVVSGVFGSTTEQSAEAAENLYNEQEALDGVGNAAKKAGKSLAGFDEINKLSSDSEGGGGSSAAIKPDFSKTIQSGLNAIIELFAGAALLALGAILTFSGANILLGIALMALGAAFMWDAITSDADLAAELVKRGLDKVLQAVGTLIAVLGVILIVTGHWAIGIGLLIAGIALWSIGAAADDGGSFADDIKNRLLSALVLISPLIAVLGVILVVTGHLLIGIGMIIVGLAIFAVSAVSDQGEVTIEKVSTALGELLSTVGVFVAILGVILLLFGQIPIGLSLLVAGVAIFAAGQVAFDFEELKENVTGALSNILKKVGDFLFVIGLILVFIPGMMGYGFGAMAGGIALSGISEMLPNWDTILENLQAAWQRIKDWWDTTVMSGLRRVKETVSNFFSGLFGAGNEGYDSGNNFGENINDGAADALGVQSPSTKFHELGDYCMQGMANGITDSQALVLETFQTVLDQLLVAYDTWEINFMSGFTDFRTAFSDQWLAFWSLMNYYFTIKWNDILQNLQSGINFAIDALNSLVAAANSLSGLTGMSYGSVGRIVVPALPLPKLAAGAVIPPNKEFLAVLGDQKSGTNIETPLSTMVQAFRQALSEGGYSGQNEAVMMVNEETLGKLVYRLNKAESTRIGVNLAEV